MTTEQIAHKLVEYCRKGEWDAPYREFYAQDAASIEEFPTPMFEKDTKGLDNMIAKAAKFDSMVETMHGVEVSEPLFAGNTIAFTLTMDITMKGQERMKMKELCIYQVKDGKVISEEFFYGS